MGYNENQQFIDFGVPQTSAMSNSFDQRDIYVENDFFWSAHSQGMYFNSTGMNDGYGYINGSYVYTIFDTGSSGIILSSDYYDQIVTKLMTDYIGTQNYVIKEGVTYSVCIPPSQLPSLYFIFNELLIEVRGEDYMADISPKGDMSLCQLLLFKNTMAFNLFGTPLFRGYYVTHDTVNAKMQFVPVPNSPKKRL